MNGTDKDTEVSEDNGVSDMLGISSSWLALKGLSIGESIEKCLELGFELVELGAAHKYEDGAVETVMELREKYPDKKFTIHARFPPARTNKPEGRKSNNSNHHYTMNLSDSKEHENILKAVKKMFDIGERLNVDVVGIHSGCAAEVRWIEYEFGFETFEMIKPIPLETAKRNMIVILEELVNIAEERGIKLAIEVQPSMPVKPLLTNPESFEWVFSNFKSKFFGLLLDIGHLQLAAASEGYNPYEFVKKFKDKIFELHLHDCKHGRDHFAVGTGEIDFKKYFEIIGLSTLKKIPIVFEYNNSVTEQQALASKALVEKMLVGK